MGTAILSAAVALLIFTLSQWFIHMRDRQTFLRGKLEELFEAFNEVSENMLESLYGAQKFEETGEKEELFTIARGINKTLYKPRTLILLYFPYLVETWEGMFVSPIRSYTAYISECCEGEKKIATENCKQQVFEFSLRIRSLQDFLSVNVGISTRNIGFHLKRIFARKIEIKIKT